MATITFTTLTTLLGSDEDMALMFLSDRAAGLSRPVEQHAEVPRARVGTNPNPNPNPKQRAEVPRARPNSARGRGAVPRPRQTRHN